MSFKVQGQQDHSPIFGAAAIGIPWATILVWLFKYGFPTVLQVLQILMAGGFSGLTMQQIIEWVVKALENIAAGLPVPPIPAPGPVTP